MTKRASSLRTRQRDHIFDASPKWKPLERKDVHGADYLFEIIDPVIALLELATKNPACLAMKFPGMLFSGESGLGKTYVARYIASAAGVRFVIGNTFPRDNEDDEWTRDDVVALFDLLRAYVKQKKQPIILFYDQFDSVISSSSEEAIAQLYTELDGMQGPLEGVLVIGATTVEHGELDPQLVRPGRFGTTVAFFPPNKKGRADILRYYLDQFPHDAIAIEDLALPLGGMSPAELKHLIDTARERAQIRAKGLRDAMITKDDILYGFIRVAIKPEGPGANGMTNEALHSAAVHEMSHAIVSHVLGRKVTLVHMVGTAHLRGATFSESRGPTMSSDDLRIFIATTLGGIAASAICGIPNELGSANDLESATADAYHLAQKLGAGLRVRSEFGPLTSSENVKSEKFVRLIEEDVAGILKAEEETARNILEGVGKEKIVALADILLKERMLFGDEFSALMDRFGIERKKQRQA